MKFKSWLSEMAWDDIEVGSARPTYSGGIKPSGKSGIELVDELDLKDLPSDMKLITSSDTEIIFRPTPIEKQRTADDYDSVLEGSSKPKGLWYACGGAWLKRTIEIYGYVFSEYIHEIKINPSNMILIQNDEQMDSFNSDFSTSGGINWEEVAKKYSGIEICRWLPKKHQPGEGYSWYYGWDVASGCIWDEDAARSIELFAHFDKTSRKYVKANP